MEGEEPHPTRTRAPYPYSSPYPDQVWCADCAASLAPGHCPVCGAVVAQSLRTYHKRL